MRTEAARLIPSLPAAAEAPPKKVPRHPLELILRGSAEYLSPRTLSAMLRVALGPARLCLCFHRVGDTGLEWTMPPHELDRLIALLVGSRPRTQARWLTLTFDDGYQDAVEYVRSRALVWPDVEWLVFACPEKTEQRLGFQWDSGRPCELATVHALRELQRLPNVAVGNHTNSHLVQTLLDPAQAEEEYVSSTADFRRLFGEVRHFAFPFGTPHLEFEREHVELLRALCPATLIWSTERRPFFARERAPGAVLPRFSIDSTWSYRQIALWICAHSVRFRVKGSPHRF